MRTLLRIVAALLGLCAVACMPGPETTFRITEFGAIGDGKTLATSAIQQAIDSCAASGGGRVVVPTGRYLTGSLRLRDNVMLQLSVGATLIASADMEHYPARRMIFAEDVSRVGIEGRGTIDGRGDQPGSPTIRPSPLPDPLIEFTGCRDVTVRDLQIVSSPADTIVLTRCELVTVEGIRIANGRAGATAAGIGVAGSRDVIVRDSSIVTGGEAIRLETHETDMVVEDVIVTGCVLSSDAAAISVGPRTSGVIRYALFGNMIIRDSRTGVALSMRDGGTIENLRFDGLTIETGGRPRGPIDETPLAIDIGHGASERPAGRIRGVSLSGIDATTRGRVVIAGLPDRPIESLSLDGLTLTVREPAALLADEPPGDGSAAEAHLALAHARGLRISDLRIAVEPADAGAARRLLWGHDLVDLVLAGVWGRQSGDPAALPAIELIDCRRVMLRDSVAAPGTETFLRLAGEDTANVHLVGNTLGQATEPVVLDHVDRGAVTVDGRFTSGR